MEWVSIFRDDFTEDPGLWLDPECMAGNWFGIKRRGFVYCFDFSPV